MGLRALMLQQMSMVRREELIATRQAVPKLGLSLQTVAPDGTVPGFNTHRTPPTTSRACGWCGTDTIGRPCNSGTGRRQSARRPSACPGADAATPQRVGGGPAARL